MLNRELPRACLLVTLTFLATIDAATAGEWRQYEDPAQAGWSQGKLGDAFRRAADVGSSSVLVIDDGIVVAAWGTVARPEPIYSMRKGIYNALVGILVGEEKIDLDATLAKLSVDEIDGLTATERSATVSQLLQSRSGIYHVSAYEPSSMKRSRPERGSSAPGERFFYNNWDFNSIAHIIEQASGRRINEIFQDRIARPLGMEDFTSDDVFRFLEPSRSRFPAVIFRMSARDLARLGQLYLAGGKWQGRRILPRKWIESSWKAGTTFEKDSPWGAGNGFGYLWWIYPGRKDAPGVFGERNVYLTRGAGGQVLAVIPSLNVVVVNQTEGGSGDAAGFDGAARVINAILAAKDGSGRRHSPKTTELRSKPLPDSRPAPVRRNAISWRPEQIRELLGTYSLGPKVKFSLHEFEGRLFALPDGIPLAEVELFIDPAGTIFSPAVDLALRLVRNDSGDVVGLKGTVEQREVTLERVTKTPER